MGEDDSIRCSDAPPDASDAGSVEGAERPPFTFDSVDAAVDHLGFGKYQLRLMLLCGLGWAADIADIAAMAFLIPALADKHVWGDKLGEKPHQKLGLAASATFVGMLAGSVFWGIISDRIGRRPSFVLTSLLAGLFGMLAASSENVWMLAAIRLALGSALGGNLAVDFTLFAENTPTRLRGRLTTLMTIFATLGSLFTVGCAWTLLENFGWRVFIVVTSAPAIIIGLARRGMHESAHFLVCAGKANEASVVLAKIAVHNNVVFDGLSDSAVGYNNSNRMSVAAQMSYLLCPALRRRTIGCWVLWFTLSFGFYGFNVFGPTYFKAQGFVANGVYSTFFVAVACQLPGTMVSTLLVERLGRRRLMVIFALGCSSMMGGIALASTKPLMVAFSLVLNFCTAALWAVTYTFTPEVFPTVIRTTALGSCSCVARVAGIIVSVLGGDIGAVDGGRSDGIVNGTTTVPLLLAETAAVDIARPLAYYALSYFLFAVCAWWLRLDMTAVALSDVQLSRRLPSDSTDGSQLVDAAPTSSDEVEMS